MFSVRRSSLRAISLVVYVVRTIRLRETTAAISTSARSTIPAMVLAAPITALSPPVSRMPNGPNPIAIASMPIARARIETATTLRINTGCIAPNAPEHTPSSTCVPHESANTDASKRRSPEGMKKEPYFRHWLRTIVRKRLRWN
jgi:hypothetical protein